MKSIFSTCYKKSFIKEEMLVNLLPVPVMVVIIFLNFPFAKDHLWFFLATVMLANGLSWITSVTARRTHFKKLFQFDKIENPTLAERGAAKENLFQAIEKNIPIIFIRWTVLAFIGVIIPYYFTKRIETYEIVAFVVLTSATGMICMPIFYLIDIQGFVPFLRSPEIASAQCNMNRVFSMRRKLFLSFLFSVLYPVVLLLFLITYDSMGYISMKDNVLALVLVAFISLFMSLLVAHFLNGSVRITMESLIGATQQFSAGSISSIEQMPVLTNDEFGKLSCDFNTLAIRMKERTTILQSIGNGDLTDVVELYSDNDELGESMKIMHDKLSDLIALIQKIANHMESGVSAISDTSGVLAASSTEQAATMEEISSSIHEILASSEDNTTRVLEVGTIAEDNKLQGDLGRKKVEEMNSLVSTISESANSMQGIIKTIESIAFQTNLLALNAAVEAARAGQHGKGFAVVADEVRSLANRSAKAVGETNSIISSVLSQVEEAHTLSEETRDSLIKIAESGATVASLVTEVREGTKSEKERITMINEAITQINDLTQNNAASSEELASSAHEMDALARDLSARTNQFHIAE